MNKLNRMVFVFFISLIFFSPYVLANAECDSTYNIYKNMDVCDGANMTLSGKVTSLDFYTSSKGNEYTVFFIDDKTATPLKVFSYTKLPISNEDIVKVKGVFNKVSRKGNYTFFDQITTSPENVFLVKKDSSNTIIPVAILILVIIGMFVVYKRYYLHKNDKDMKHEIGASFENYVQSLFDQKEWVIVDRTKDLSKEVGRKVESDSNPDFIFRHKDTDKVIAVECKYHSKFILGKSEYGTYWTAGEYQIKKYNEFWEKTKYPVFIAVGIGGIPSKPQQLFLVPLYALKYKWASKDYIEKFERGVTKQVMLEEIKKYYRSVF